MPYRLRWKPLILLFLINIDHILKKSNCVNYSYQPNLLFIVKSNRKIEDNERIVPKIIKGFDFSLGFNLDSFFEKDIFLSLLRRFENGLFIVNYK